MFRHLNAKQKPIKRFLNQHLTAGLRVPVTAVRYTGQLEISWTSLDRTVWTSLKDGYSAKIQIFGTTDGEELFPPEADRHLLLGNHLDRSRS